jgi:diguanylate cyclase (GGDEF)-like protein
MHNSDDGSNTMNGRRTSPQEREYPSLVRAALLEDRAKYNRDTLVPLAALLCGVFVLLIAQHHLSPGVAIEWLRHAYSALYIVGLVVAAGTLLFSVTVARIADSALVYPVTLLCGMLLVIFGAALSVLDSAGQTESVAYALTLLVFVAAFRARLLYHLAVVVVSLGGYLIAHTLIWGPLNTAALIETVTVAVFAVWLGFVLERRRRETFLLRRELDAQNRKLALHQTSDPLTGLWNRRAFMDHLRIHSQQLKRYGAPLSVLLLDIDGLSLINDRFGRHVGDGVLKGVADIVQTNIRKSDEAGRFGGKELAIILTHTRQEAAYCTAERLRESLARKVFTDHAVTITASVGVAQCHDSDTDPDDALMRADAALYQAKENGRNTVCIAADPTDYSGTGM